MSHLKPENHGGLGKLVSARAELQRGMDTLNEAVRVCNGASGDDFQEIERLQSELVKAYAEGYEHRDMEGQNLYNCLALFDKRDGSPLADIVQAAREGWERSHTDMDEDGAWDDFDRLIHRYNEATLQARRHRQARAAR